MEQNHYFAVFISETWESTYRNKQNSENKLLYGIQIMKTTNNSSNFLKAENSGFETQTNNIGIV